MPFVCKADGAIQCQAEPKALTLEEARAILVSLIGEDNVIGDGHTHSQIVIQLCGHVSGVYHHFKITDQGEFILERGIMGRQGFRACPGDEAENQACLAENDDGETNLGKILQECDLTSAASMPVLIRELIGRPVRVYNYGDPITKDLVEGRVNIERDKTGSNIRRIWFG